MWPGRSNRASGCLCGGAGRRLDALADAYGNGTLKLTTRQTFQLHGVLKRDLPAAIQGFDEVQMDSIAGCGDVNRNVMCNTNPHEPAVRGVRSRALPRPSARTTAYREIWPDGSLVETTEAVDDEPIYGHTYLPRKFKIALALPPYNDSDIFSNDIGLIATEENGQLAGFNVAIGGGLGMTFGQPATYPRLADVIGFVTTDKVLDVCEKIVTIQRDWGNRENRKQSCFK